MNRYKVIMKNGCEYIIKTDISDINKIILKLFGNSPEVRTISAWNIESDKCKGVVFTSNEISHIEIL